jgi:sec-independent protein translocase protein TatA
MFRQFGAPELIIILTIALLIFGPSKLPQLGQAIGKTIRGFRQTMAGTEEEAADESSPAGKE